MIFIRKNSDDSVQLGGTVATKEMVDDGWFSYTGPIPQGNNLRLIDGVLQAYEPEIPVLRQIQLYKEYLTNTDFKMHQGYIPKEGEDLEAVKKQRNVAREYIRANDPLKNLLANTVPVTI